MEPISPELALVDPELARAHIAWLELSSELRPTRPPPAPVAERRRRAARVEPWWSVAAKSLAALSLAANGFLAAVVVARDRPTAAAQTPVAALAVPAPPAAPDVPSAQSTSPGTNAALEQQVLSLVFQSPSRLPRTLVDTTTGLPKNNLQAVCRDGPADSQLCIVRPARHRPGEGLYVRYTPGAGGRGSFTWYPYRTG